MRFKREKVSALVLARRDVGEADRLLTLFTREHGLVRAEARGVRRIPSRRGGHLEPLTRIVCLLAGTGSPGGQAHGRYFISGAESEEPFTALHQDAAAQASAEQLAALLVQLVQFEEAHPELYDAYTDVLAALPSLSPAKRAVLEVGCTLFALAQSGFQVTLQQCVRCGAKQPEGSAILSGRAGGWHCLTCSDSFREAQQALSTRCLRALRWLAEHPQSALRLRVTAEEGQQLRQAMRRFGQELTQSQPAHVAV